MVKESSNIKYSSDVEEVPLNVTTGNTEENEETTIFAQELCQDVQTLRAYPILEVSEINSPTKSRHLKAPCTVNNDHRAEIQEYPISEASETNSLAESSHERQATPLFTQEFRTSEGCLPSVSENFNLGIDDNCADSTPLNPLSSFQNFMRFESYAPQFESYTPQFESYTPQFESNYIELNSNLNTEEQYRAVRSPSNNECLELNPLLNTQPDNGFNVSKKNFPSAHQNNVIKESRVGSAQKRKKRRFRKQSNSKKNGQVSFDSDASSVSDITSLKIYNTPSKVCCPPLPQVVEVGECEDKTNEELFIDLLLKIKEFKEDTPNKILASTLTNIADFYANSDEPNEKGMNLLQEIPFYEGTQDDEASKKPSINQKMRTIDIIDVEGVMASNGDCGLCQLNITRGNETRHLTEVHKVDRKKIRSDLSKNRKRNIDQTPKQCYACGSVFLRLARHLEKCVENPEKNKEMHTLAKQATKNLKKQSQHENITYFEDQVKIYLEWLRGKTIYGGSTQYQKKSLGQNLVRLAKLLHALGKNPNLFFLMLDPRHLSSCENMLADYCIALNANGKSPNTAKSYLQCLKSFLMYYYRSKSKVPLITDIDVHLKDMKKAAKRKLDEGKYDFEAGMKVVRIIFEIERAPYVTNILGIMKETVNWCPEYTGVLMSILLFQNVQRVGAIANMTCEEFNNGHFMDVEGKSFYVVRTAEHKTAKDHGRARITFRSPIIYELTKKYLESHRPEPKDTDAAMYLFLTSSGTRISSARFYQHYNDVISKCDFQFLLGKSLDEDYKSATNTSYAKINMNSVRRACSTIAQDTHDEVLFGVVCDQMTHSKLVARSYYKNLQSLNDAAKNNDKIHKCLETLVNNNDIGETESQIESAYLEADLKIYRDNLNNLSTINETVTSESSLINPVTEQKIPFKQSTNSSVDIHNRESTLNIDEELDCPNSAAEINSPTKCGLMKYNYFRERPEDKKLLLTIFHHDIMNAKSDKDINASMIKQRLDENNAWEQLQTGRNKIPKSELINKIRPVVRQPIKKRIKRSGGTNH